MAATRTQTKMASNPDGPRRVQAPARARSARPPAASRPETGAPASPPARRGREAQGSPARTLNRYRHVVVPGLGWRPRFNPWQVLGGLVAMGISIAGLIWVFTGHATGFGAGALTVGP